MKRSREAVALAQRLAPLPTRQVPEAAQRKAAATWARKLDWLARVVDGDLKTTSWTWFPDGRVQKTEAEPTTRDRLQALDMLAKYGRVPVGPMPEPGQGGSAPADLPTLVRALGLALADPGVRGWLERAHPDVVGTLRAASATDVTDLANVQAEASQGDSEDHGV